MPTNAIQPFALRGSGYAVALSAFCPYVYVQDEDRWQLALVGWAGAGGGGELEVAGLAPRAFAYARSAVLGDALVLSGESGGARVTTEIRITDGGLALRFETILEATTDLDLGSLRASFWFVPRGKPLSQYGRLDDSWAPHRAPGRDHVVPDRAFRSPLLAVEQGGLGALLLPELPVGRDGRLATTLSLDLADRRRDAPRLTIAREPWEPDGERYFARRPGEFERIAEGSRIALAYEIRAFPVRARGEALRRGLRLLWARHGSRTVGRCPPERLPWGEVASASYAAGLETDWREARVAKKKSGGFRSRDDDRILFEARSHALRTAYGLAIWGARLDQADWRKAANRIATLALASPVRSGCFPAAFDPTTGDWSLRGPGANPSDTYALADMATTALWMLRWNDSVATSRAFSARARALGEFLVASQLPSGAVPAFFREEGLRPDDRLRDGADTAAAVLLFTELAASDQDGSFLRAAARGAGFLLRDVIPGRRYRDFESALDGDGAPIETRDDRSGLSLAGTLSIHWTTEALRRLFEVTGEGRFLDAARRVLDDLAAYQQVGGPRFLEETYGGFGATNESSARGDARGPLFAEAFLRLYRLTGETELFERGVAALESGFGSLRRRDDGEEAAADLPGAQTIAAQARTAGSGLVRSGFDQGEGSLLAAAARVIRTFGGIYVDPARRYAHGIDGCRVETAGDGRTLEIEVEETLGRTRTIDVVIDTPLEPDRLDWDGLSVDTRRDGASHVARLPLAAGQRSTLRVGLRPADERAVALLQGI